MRTLISLSFFLSALWFAAFSGVGSVPLEELPAIPAHSISTEPGRSLMSDPPTTRIGGLEQSCSSCHAIFPSTHEEPRERLQHQDIVLEHGLNNRCDNCHTKGDHDKLVLYGGLEVGYDRVQELCAKCHGPTYRDWQVGMHGKTLGSWEVGSPEQRRLLCTECHDPHSPAFPVIEPLRGPHTLRQHATERDPSQGHAAKRNPLRHWQQSQADHDSHTGGGH